MSVPSDPLAAAAKVQTPLQAARLNDELETELAMGENQDPGWEAAAEQARDQLADRFGGFDALHEKTGGKQPKPVRTPDGVVKPKPKSAPAKAPKTSKPAPRTARGKGSPAGRGRAPAGSTKTGRRRTPRGVRRFAGQVAGPYSDAGSFALWLVAGSLGLALLYLLITGRGPDAVKWSTATWAKGLRAFLAPVDPLDPNGAVKATAAKAVAGSKGPSAADKSGAGGGGDFAPSITTPRADVPVTNAAGKALLGP